MARVESLTADQIRSEIAALLASPALTGTPTAPTPSPGDNDTSIATTAFVVNALSSASADNQFWIGTGGPGAGLGTDGDIYMDKSNGRFHVKIAGLGWGTETTFLEDLNNAAIKSSLLTAKGDLIARGGSGPLRRSIGVNGEVLIADSAQVTGMRWGTPTAPLRHPLPKIGWAFGPTDAEQFTNNSDKFGTNHGTAVQFIIESTMTIDQVAVLVDTANAASTVYAALWGSDSSGYPTSLVEERNLGSASATGVLGANVTWVLNPGIYWGTVAVSTVGTLRLRGMQQNQGMKATNFGMAQAASMSPRWEVRRNNASAIAFGQAGQAGVTPLTLSDALADGLIWIGMRRSA